MRRLLLSLTLALTLSAVGASTALAEAPEGAQKAPLYGPNGVGLCPVGGEPTPKTFGFAVLNTPGDETTLTGEVALKGAKPNTEYFVEAGQVTFGPGFTDCERIPVGTITTNKKGNGNLYFTTARLPGTTLFFVEVLFNLREEFASPAVELD